MNDEQSIETAIQQSAPGGRAPRLRPADIDAAIASEDYHVFDGKTTVCCLTLNNGAHVLGKSWVISRENFDAEIGRRVARDDARSQVWQLEGYLLTQRLAETPDPSA